MAGVLPPLYEPWIEEVVGGPLPVESRSTCGSCAMLKRGSVDDPEQSFDTRTKCCTYTPFLPNYLVGAILGDAEMPAREVIAARIEARVGVTPMGLAPSVAARQLYQTTMEGTAPAFGRMVELRCPYYQPESGACGVWRHRDSVCSTWFCRHLKGNRGRRFWKIMKGALQLVERGLILHAIGAMGVDAAACEALYFYEARPVAQPFRDDVHMAIWGSWLGAEREFFAGCHAAIAGLTWAQVLETGGAPLAHMAKALRHAYVEYNDDPVPAQVDRGPELLYRIGRRPDHLRVTSPVAPYDFIEIPKSLASALPRLIRRPIEEAILELAGEGIEIDLDVVRRLIDFQVVVPA